jgi:hypothetical protein
MDTLNDNAQPTSARLTRCTPSQLRAIADRLEAIERHGWLPGQAIVYPLNHFTTLVYEPDTTTTQFCNTRIEPAAREAQEL